MKTPEQMAIKYIKDVETARNPSVAATAFPQMQRCFLAGYKAAQDQVADVSKVMCNTTMEEIKAVDTGEIIPISNLPTPGKWISVKDRLPELGIHVLTYGIYTKDTIVAWRDDCDELLGMYDWVTEDRLLSQITHWMPLPAPPEDNK